MRITWKYVNKLKIAKKKKNRLFVLAMILESTLAGAWIWLLLGRLFLADVIWLWCFMGYPGLFIGLILSMLFLYNHEFA